MIKERKKICPQCKEKGREGLLKPRKLPSEEEEVLGCLNYPECSFTRPYRNRSKLFKEISSRRLKKAIEAIELIGNLSQSEHTNYSYTEQEVRDIFGKLNYEVKNQLSRFNSGFIDRKPMSTKDKFERLIELDRQQYAEIRKTDPELADYVLKHLPGVKAPFQQLEGGLSESIEELSEQMNQFKYQLQSKQDQLQSKFDEAQNLMKQFSKERYT